MATPEERVKVLKMIQDGKITAAEGARLLDALGTKRPAPVPAPPPQSSFPGRPRWLRVRVTDTNSGKTRVNVRLPVSLLDAGLKMGARFSPEVEGLDIQQLNELIQSGETGKIVDVFDDEDGEHVEVFVE
jgi:hypothetical protein